MRRAITIITNILAAGTLAAVTTTVSAGVSQEEADKLKGELTPLGAERAGNGDAIPDWEGGLTTPPENFGGDGARYVDAFPDDKPLFTITNANKDKYKDNLSAGQIAMFEKFPDSFKMPVFQTRRTMANPEHVYEETYKNATRAELVENGEGVANAVIGIPFPIPKSGKEIVWNHKLRYRTKGGTRYNNQAAVQSNGRFTVVTLREDVRFHYSYPGVTPEDLNNVAIYFLQETESPAKLSGSILLVHETMNQVAEPRRAWIYNTGQRRLRRAPNVGYDNPGNGSDGLRFNDQLDVFNGATDRYVVTIKGKKEMYIPYNAYRIHSDELKYEDIIKQGHLNQDYARYELHRVWVVEMFNEESLPDHLYKKRVIYVDEDSWGIHLVDAYDQRDQLWGFQEAHSLVAYDKPAQGAAIETVYDLLKNRYLALAMNNEHPETIEKEFDKDYFTTSNVIKMAKK